MANRFLFALCAVLAIAAAPALAQQAPKTPSAPAKPAPEPPKIDRLGASQSWPAFAETAKNGRACYLVGQPQKSEPANLKRGEIRISVTHRPAEKSYNVVNFIAGYPFKDGTEVELTVDARKFALFTSKEGAWARDPATDKAIVEAMAKGKQLVLKGTSARGAVTTDTYQLAGFPQSLAEIDKACGLKR